MQQRWLRAVVMTGALAVLGFTVAAPALAQGGVPWLGVYTQTLNADLRAGIDYDGDGVLVSGVVDDSPADRAGVRKGDVIVTFNSRRVEASGDLTELVRNAKVDQEVTLSIWRAGQRRSLTPRLVARPAGQSDDVAPRAPAAPKAPGAPKAEKSPRVWVWDDDGGERHEIDLRGLERLKLLEDMEHWDPIVVRTGRPRLGITMDGASGGGVRVTDVLDDTPAERAGLREGDVIVRIGGTEIDDSEDLGRVVRGAPEGPIPIEVRRDGATHKLEATLGPKRDRETRTFRMRAPSPGAHGETYWRSRDSDGLRREIDELRREIEKLQRELERQTEDR